MALGISRQRGRARLTERGVKRVVHRICSAVLLALIATWPSLAAADAIEDFYKGKQIRVVIRAAPGGNYDLYSRLLIRHMVRFIPGHPPDCRSTCRAAAG